MSHAFPPQKTTVEPSFMKKKSISNRVLLPSSFYETPSTPLKSETKKQETEVSLRSTLVVFLLFGAFFVIIAFLGKYGILAFNEMETHQQQLIQDIEVLHNQEQKLLQEVDALQNNPAYIEALARKELGLVHKDEVIYFLRSPEVEKEDKTQKIEENSK